MNMDMERVHHINLLVEEFKSHNLSRADTTA